MQKGKVVVWGGLTNRWEEKRKAKETQKDIATWMQSSKEEQGEIRQPSEWEKIIANEATDKEQSQKYTSNSYSSTPEK